MAAGVVQELAETCNLTGTRRKSPTPNLPKARPLGRTSESLSMRLNGFLTCPVGNSSLCHATLSSQNSSARTKPSGAVSLGGGAQTPRKKVRWCFRSSARVSHSAGMAFARQFRQCRTILLLSDIPHTTLAIEDAAQYHQFLC
jgi:hypothetical protein